MAGLVSRPPRLFFLCLEFRRRRYRPGDDASQVIQRDRNPRQIRHRRPLKYDHKAVRAAIAVSAIHPAFTLNRAVITPGCSGGNSIKIGPALSLTPKGGAGVRPIGYQSRWSTMRIPLTFARITSAAV